MKTTAEGPKRSADDYLAGEETSPIKHPIGEGEELALASLGFRCPMAAVYEDVELG